MFLKNNKFKSNIRVLNHSKFCLYFLNKQKQVMIYETNLDLEPLLKGAFITDKKSKIEFREGRFIVCKRNLRKVIRKIKRNLRNTTMKDDFIYLLENMDILSKNRKDIDFYLECKKLIDILELIYHSNILKYSLYSYNYSCDASIFIRKEYCN